MIDLDKGSRPDEACKASEGAPSGRLSVPDGVSETTTPSEGPLMSQPASYSVVRVTWLAHGPVVDVDFVAHGDHLKRLRLRTDEYSWVGLGSDQRRALASLLEATASLLRDEE